MKKKRLGEKEECGMPTLYFKIITGLHTINLFMSVFLTKKKFALSSNNSALLALSFIKFPVMSFPNVKPVILFIVIETRIAFQTQSCQHKITTDKVTPS